MKYFGNFLGLGCILVIDRFWGYFGHFFRFLGYFGHCFRFWGYFSHFLGLGVFNHFIGFRGIFVIF